MNCSADESQAFRNVPGASGIGNYELISALIEQIVLVRDSLGVDHSGKGYQEQTDWHLKSDLAIIITRLSLPDAYMIKY